MTYVLQMCASSFLTGETLIKLANSFIGVQSGTSRCKSFVCRNYDFAEPGVLYLPHLQLRKESGVHVDL